MFRSLFKSIKRNPPTDKRNEAYGKNLQFLPPLKLCTCFKTIANHCFALFLVSIFYDLKVPFCNNRLKKKKLSIEQKIHINWLVLNL